MLEYSGFVGLELEESASLSAARPLDPRGATNAKYGWGYGGNLAKLHVPVLGCL